jgi:DNA-binding phage protein
MDESQNVEELDEKGETARLMELLRTVVRMLGYTNRDVARRGGLHQVTAAKYFRGEGEPKLDFVLAVLRAIELQPWEFFDFAYPERGEPSAAGRTVRRLLTQFTPASTRPAEKPPLQGRELEEMLDELREELRREIRALAAKS